MPREVQIPQAVGEQPQQQVPAPAPAPGPAPGPGNLPAPAAAQPAQLTAEEKLEVNLKFKLFSYLQISSSGRLYSHSLTSLAAFPWRFCCAVAFWFWNVLGVFFSHTGISIVMPQNGYFIIIPHGVGR